jgi:uncharacterized protein YecE (DUF72 family)
MTPGLWIGTSGWVYRHWLGIFYPRGMAGAAQLPFYAERFPTVEVNFSFYRLPERPVFETWRAQTPDGFRFAVKGSRYLTHMKKLKEPEEPLRRLMERATGLGEKLGPILFQFPHTWTTNLDRLRAFLQASRLYAPQRFAFEFRHQSWLQPATYALLEAAGAALCLPVSPAVPLDVRATTSWTYVRVHGGQWGTGLSDDEIATWAGHVAGFLDRGLETYVYFNNDPEGHALRDAARLRQRLAEMGWPAAGTAPALLVPAAASATAA